MAFHNFRKLEVYKRALLFGRTVRQMTARFPRQEMFAPNSQYKRAVDSIALNIAEGSGSGSKKEFSKFIGYSIRSGYECGSCADIAATQQYISRKEYEDVVHETDEIISMLIGLQRSIQRDSS